MAVPICTSLFAIMYNFLEYLHSPVTFSLSQVFIVKFKAMIATSLKMLIIIILSSP